MGLEFSGGVAQLRDDKPEGEWKWMLIRKPKELSFAYTGGLCDV
ncbi:c6bceb27-ff95-4953-aadc-dc8d74c91e3d [Thermothielavioides terrestris]|uniref:C6bceb27-ff95-4953-aadc-dc8d74c91e3d n=1 Tax=Thermothielavioides terrestris TaxID=2587410 RepID=A0A3S4ASH2_9PEZI|nr:c6bceb27-ff95-4953-aadc-dc8d74c91e3d [Thermothielavioides terrestris]